MVFVTCNNGRNARVRGAAAMEFAFVAPIFMMLLAAILSFGLAMVTRYRMANAASAVARSCTAIQRSGDSTGTLQTCAQTVYQQQLNLSGGQFGCETTPLFEAQTQVISTGRPVLANRSIVMLTARITCGVSINPLVNYLSVGMLPSTLTLSAASAMPFVISG